MGCLLYCNTGSLRKHKSSVPCCILLSNYYVIVKVCSRNIMGSTNLACNKKVILQGPVRLSFQGLLSFRGKEKSAKWTFLATEHCVIYSTLIFATQSLIVSLQYIKLCTSLLNQSLWTLYYLMLLLTRKNICNLIAWEEYIISRVYTLFSIFVLCDSIRKKSTTFEFRSWKIEMYSLKTN